MTCTTLSTTSASCPTITTIEPDGNTGQAIDESGSTPIPLDVAQLEVFFQTTKASTNYRFEYLYIDALNPIPVSPFGPGAAVPIVIRQTLFSFTVDLAGIPLAAGYVLRWRVVVQDLDLDVIVVDSPENLRVQLIQNVRSQTITFVNPRSTTDYGFSELRIENLIDPVDGQRSIVPQVSAKTLGNFTVGFSTKADTNHYFLVARTP